jgi:hypothetical protein
MPRTMEPGPVEVWGMHRRALAPEDTSAIGRCDAEACRLVSVLEVGTTGVVLE